MKPVVIIHDVIIDDISEINDDVICNDVITGDWYYSTPSRQTRKLKPITCFTRTLQRGQSQDITLFTWRDNPRNAKLTGQSSTNAYA